MQDPRGIQRRHAYSLEHKLCTMAATTDHKTKTVRYNTGFCLAVKAGFLEPEIVKSAALLACLVP